MNMLRLLLAVPLLAIACDGNATSNDLVGYAVVLRADTNDATFVDGEFFHDDGSSCVVSEVGPCQTWQCGLQPSADVGSIDTERSSGGALHAKLNDDGFYSAVGAADFLQAGDTIRFSTSGSSPLEASLAVPVKAALVSRTIEQNMPIDPTEDWVFDWKGGDGGSIVVNLVGSDALGFSRASCAYDAADRRGAIPKAALELVRERALTASIHFSSATRAFPIDGGRVWFGVEDPMIDAAGHATHVLIRFE